MNRGTFILAMLLVIFSAALAGAADPPKEKPVAVDPMDLRTPVPDPEKGLSEKYDGKEVVFTGAFHSTGQDVHSKQRWYKLAVPAIQVQNSPTEKPKMQTVVVQIFFAGTERRLPARTASYTVQGTGHITVDGALMIRNARTVSVGPLKTSSGR